MTRLMSLRSEYFIAALGLTCFCNTPSFAQPAAPGGMEGGLTAYQVDGVYKGKSQPIVSNDGSCHPAREVVLDVQMGRFQLPWNDRQVFDAKIARDGTFYATTGALPIQAEKHMTSSPTLRGGIGQTGLVADYGTRWCRYLLEANLPPMLQQTESDNTRR